MVVLIIALLPPLQDLADHFSVRVSGIEAIKDELDEKRGVVSDGISTISS